MDIISPTTLFNFNENGIALNKNNTKIKAIYRLKNHPTRFIDKSYLQEFKETKKVKKPIKLRLEPEQYLGDYQKLYPDKTNEEIIKLLTTQLVRIKKELDNFQEFCFKYITKVEITVDSYLGYVQRLLGWLYLPEKNLEKVSLIALIPLINTNLKIDDFENIEEYALAKEKCKYESKEAAKNVREFIKFFFKRYEVVNINSQNNYINSLITLAKYLYKELTDEEQIENYEDIVIIQSLRNFSCKLKKNSSGAKIKNLKFTWDELLIIREQLKYEASLAYSFSKLKNGGKHNDSRTESAIATSKMRFLIFCLLTIIPPDRARTIRELRIGETLKHGIITKEGFISQENLSNSAEAKYYIHLQEKDYKTGKIYGEFLGQIPNCQFEDDTKFYDYLNDWIYGGWREVLLRNEPHNYCFCKSRKSQPHSINSLHDLVANTFKNKTGIRMGTHPFRDIFCTYLEEVNAPAEVRASAAYWMKHSEQMARKVYTVVDLQNKLAPAFEFMNQLNF